MLAGFVILLVAMIKFFPDTPTGRGLHRLFVEIPIEQCAKFERRHLIFLVLFVLMAESLMVIGAADLATAYLLDLSTYFDVLTVAAVLKAVTPIKSGVTKMNTRLKLRFRRPATSRARHKGTKASVGRQRPKASNDDGGPRAQLRVA
jgi:hypothetical protein